MSHVVIIDPRIQDLGALQAACAVLGLEFKEGQTKFKWYGTHVGDYPIPTGFTKSDMGKCDHAIVVKGNSKAYQIGVVKRRDGQQGYMLMFDFYMGGHGLMQKVGPMCKKLLREYSKQVALKHARRRGYRVRETQRGKELVLTLTK